MSDRVLAIIGVAGFAERYGLKLGTVYSHLSRGTNLPPFFKVGAKTFWKLSDVLDWEEKQLKERKRRISRINHVE